MSQLRVSVSPHISSRNTTQRVMLDVIISLLPVSIASVLIFGLNAAVLLCVCVASAVVAEYLFNRAVKKEQTISDLSAIVTGLLLALNLPSETPLWQAVVGSVFAIVVVKGLFGGLGQNFANPAITARVMMLLSFGSTLVSGGSAGILPKCVPDFISGATPLAVKTDGMYDWKILLFGNYVGAIGETCAIALLIGFVYLLIRRVITWQIPVIYVGTVALFALAVGEDPIYQILAGSLLLGAVFMATDYATSPTSTWGKVIFGFGCGVITFAIRQWGNYPEGVSFAILFMNILTPYIEKATCKKPLGGVNA